MVKHEGLRAALDAAYAAGLYVHRDHLGARNGYDHHVTRITIVDLNDDFYLETMVATHKVDDQINIINQAIDSVRGE